MKKQINSLKKYRNQEAGERIEQNGPRTKNGNRNNKENTKGGNPGDGQLRKEIRSYRCKHLQQNTRERRQNLRHKDTTENIDTTVKKTTKF